MFVVEPEARSSEVGVGRGGVRSPEPGARNPELFSTRSRTKMTVLAKWSPGVKIWSPRTPNFLPWSFWSPRPLWDLEHVKGITFFIGVSTFPRRTNITAPKFETLWIFGDSQAERLHVSIQDTPLCTETFKSCNLSKMWVYPWPRVQPVAWDDKDFDFQQILDHIRDVLERTQMNNENSAMILNLGLHYIESTNFTNYQRLLNGVVDLLNERNPETGELKYKARVIWKTTTSMCKEKDIGSRLKADWQRFLNLPVGIQLTVV